MTLACGGISNEKVGKEIFYKAGDCVRLPRLLLYLFYRDTTKNMSVCLRPSSLSLSVSLSLSLFPISLPTTCNFSSCLSIRLVYPSHLFTLIQPSILFISVVSSDFAPRNTIYPFPCDRYCLYPRLYFIGDLLIHIV